MNKNKAIDLLEEVLAIKMESQTIECKAAYKEAPKKLYGTLSSFSNQDSGGYIIFGVDETEGFACIGVSDAHKVQQQVTAQCNDMVPTVRADFTIITYEEKVVLIAYIPPIDLCQRPCYYRPKGMGGSYIRVGDADELMSAYEIYAYSTDDQRMNDDLRVVDWIKGVDLLDESTVDEYLRREELGNHNLSKLDKAHKLQLLGVKNGEYPTLAANFCMGLYPQGAFPQLCVTAIAVPGEHIGSDENGGIRFLANENISGTIGEMLEKTLQFIIRNTDTRVRFNPDGRRIDETEYPMIAVREVILNALMHRDYSVHSEGVPIRVELYQNRLEVSNVGAMYGAVQMDEIGRSYTMTRNPRIAHMLEVLAIAENRHSGIATIRNQMNMRGFAEPVFESKRGRFIVSLFNNRDKLNQNTEATNDSILAFCEVARTREEIAKFYGVSKTYAIGTLLKPYIESGEIMLTVPEIPRSRNQKYITKT